MKTPRFWQQKNLLSLALLPLAALYKLGSFIDRATTTPLAAPLPVISIGNVTAGGAGKTPTTMALIPLLQALGTTPHILTRGYKGQTTHAHRVQPGDAWQQVGDEPLLLARLAPTWVGRDRLASARKAAAYGATLLVCDDALQHYRLKKTLSLLVIDGAYGLGNGHLMPAGPLRETLASALPRCDAVVLIGEDSQQLAAQISLPIFRARLAANTDGLNLADHQWLPFAGLGRPSKFYDLLHELGAPIATTCDFPDHHAYSEADIAQLLSEADKLGARLITTEKDAVKLPPDALARISVLPLSLQFDDPAAVTAFLRQQLQIT